MKTRFFKDSQEINPAGCLRYYCVNVFCQLRSDETVMPRSLKYWTISTVLAGLPELQDRG